MRQTVEAAALVMFILMMYLIAQIGDIAGF
jgi:hypothetical protein